MDSPVQKTKPYQSTYRWMLLCETGNTQNQGVARLGWILAWLEISITYFALQSLDLDSILFIAVYRVLVERLHFCLQMWPILVKFQGPRF